MTDTISTVEQLEALVGIAPLGVRMKIIDHIDASAAKWIAASPLAFAAFAAFAGEGAPRVGIAGGVVGFAAVPEPSKLVLPRAALDDIGAVEVGQGAGALFLVPGIGETLRVNGRVSAAGGDAIEIAVEECFLHCAKALIRSDFWAAAPAEGPPDAAVFLNATRFLALATADRDGRIDISPKGDPANLLVRLNAGTAILAERPGNRLAFGYRNIIERPAVSAIALIPGAASAVTLTGTAHLSSDAAVRAAFDVDRKTPILATVLAAAKLTLAGSPALARSGIWSRAQPTPEIDPSAILVTHLKLNKTRGDEAKAIRAFVERDAVAKGLEQSYRTTLY